MDASFMNSEGRWGAVAGVGNTQHPVSVARALSREKHCLLVGAGGEDAARRLRAEDCRADNSVFITQRRREQWEALREEDKQHEATLDHNASQEVEGSKGTVGAVAVDVHGNLAAATSTGGMMMKPKGRVGDSPIVGAGTWCDKRVAVSCTGTGEEFIRVSAAHRVAMAMEFGKMGLSDAAQTVMSLLAEDDGGLIAVARDGSFVHPFNTTGMLRGWAEGGQGAITTTTMIWQTK